MKSFISIPIFLISILLLSSCAEEQFECLRVDGVIENETRSLTGFDKVFFNNIGDLHITQGAEFNFEAKGQRIILDALETSIENEELIININECFNGEAYQLDLYITAPEFEEIEMAGVGKVTTQNVIIADTLTLILSGISPAFNISCDVDSLSSRLSGDGIMKLSGQSDRHSILHSGIGDIQALDLATNHTNVRLNGLGDCYVNASETLNATLNSMGNVYYTGFPTINKQGDGGGGIIDSND